MNWNRPILALTASLFSLSSISCTRQPGGPDALTAPSALGPEATQSGAGAPSISRVPAEDSGPPFYTPVFIGGAAPPSGFVPTDGNWAAIHWYRDPSCVPGGFNLLKVFNPPAAFGCRLTIQGEVWRHEPGDQIPFQEHYTESGSVPIYFVRLSELTSAVSDGMLTIGELQGLPSLLVGHASGYRSVIHNSNQASNHGHETLTARGQLTDGRSFHFHYDEKFIGGQHTLQSVRIEF
jgi:hypothetical protein